MRESDIYMEPEDWEMMYIILYKGISEAMDRLGALPGNKEVCGILVEAIGRTEEYERMVRGAVLGESDEALRKRREGLRLFGRDADSPLTDW